MGSETERPEDAERNQMKLVLRRAIEIADQQEAVLVEDMSTTISEIAAELHVPPTAVSDALAEHRAGVLEQLETGRGKRNLGAGVIDSVVGPSTVVVRHRTGIDNKTVTDNLADVLRRRYGMRTRITEDGTVVALHSRGVMSKFFNQARAAVNGGSLTTVNELRAAAVEVEPGRTSICLFADVSQARKQSVTAGSFVTAGGTAVAGVAFLLAYSAVSVVALPVSVGAGIVVTRYRYRGQLRRVTEEMEFAADHVAAGTKPPSLLDRLAKGRNRNSTPPGDSGRDNTERS